MGMIHATRVTVMKWYNDKGTQMTRRARGALGFQEIELGVEPQGMLVRGAGSPMRLYLFFFFLPKNFI